MKPKLYLLLPILLLAVLTLGGCAGHYHREDRRDDRQDYRDDRQDDRQGHRHGRQDDRQDRRHGYY